MYHDVRAVLYRPQKGGRSEGGIHYQRQMVPSRDFGVFLYVGDVENRIADRLYIYGARAVVYRGFGCGEVVDFCEARLDSVLRENRVELGVGAAVQIVRAHEFVSGAQYVENGERYGGSARGYRERGGPLVERGEALFEHVVCGVHEARVDVAALFQGEEVGSVFGALEVVGGRPVNGNGARECRRVGNLSRMNGEGFVSVFHFNFLNFRFLFFFARGFCSRRKRARGLESRPSSARQCGADI